MHPVGTSCDGNSGFGPMKNTENLPASFSMCSNGHPTLPFPRYDSLTGVPSHQRALAFEKGSVLFNIGALHTQIGARQDRASLPGLNQAIDAFQKAAGMWVPSFPGSLKAAFPWAGSIPYMCKEGWGRHLQGTTNQVRVGTMLLLWVVKRSWDYPRATQCGCPTAVGMFQLGTGDMLICLQAARNKRDPTTVVTQSFGEGRLWHKDGLDSKGGTPHLFAHWL